MNHPLATAADEWDRRWQAEEGRADWLEPEREVIATAERCHAAGGRVALDIGCGIGRHALALASIGFQVTGIDGSGSGLAYAARDAERHGLGIDFRNGSMLSLPMADASLRLCAGLERDLSRRPRRGGPVRGGDRPRAEARRHLPRHHAVQAQPELRSGAGGGARHLRDRRDQRQGASAFLLRRPDSHRDLPGASSRCR